MMTGSAQTTPCSGRSWPTPQGGTELVPDGVLEIEVGSVAAGMVEAVPFVGPLPAGETIEVGVDTSRQGDGFFFEMADLEPGEIFAGGYGHIDSERFASIASNLC